MSDSSGIYKFSFPNGKSYVGQAINIRKRWQTHKNTINCSTHKLYKMPLYNAFRKYGWNNIVKEVLCECSKDLLDEMEIKYIKEYNTVHPSGYNLTSGGNFGKNMSSYTIEKMRAALIKRHKDKPMKSSSKIQISNSLKKYYREVGEKLSTKEKKCASHRKYEHGLPRYVNVRHFPTRTVYCIGKHPKIKYMQFNSLKSCLLYLFMLDNINELRLMIENVKSYLDKVNERLIRQKETLDKLEKMIYDFRDKMTELILSQNKQE